MFSTSLSSALITAALRCHLLPTHFFGNQLSLQCNKMKHISNWSFSSPNLLRTFPIDPITENYVRKVPGCVFSAVKPTPLKTDLKLVAASEDALVDILDMDPSSAKDNPKFLNFVAGNELLENSDPLSHRYGGFQFGYWADQLGDGRAITLGQYVNRKGEIWELQLKGAGRTPYSRFGDGRAVLRSSIREFLCSEAMHALGVPTSRAASVIVSKDMVVRDEFYNGRAKLEPCAVVLRVAPTWFRIGSLEILAKEQEIDIMKNIIDYVNDHHMPHVGRGDYVKFFQVVVEQSASLVAQWMACGFTHGVLNTDNMSLLSITIDYGPFGFLDSYDPSFVPNHSDDEGRYSYYNQPKIFKWNMVRLADALQPLIESDEHKQLLNEKIEEFDSIYKQEFLSAFRRKLGLIKPTSGDVQLIQKLLDMMHLRRTDFTQTFRQLGQIDLFNLKLDDKHWALEGLSNHQNFGEFIDMYKRAVNEIGITDERRREVMNQTNPQYVLRNWMAEAAIRKAAADDFYLTNVLLRVLRNPYSVDEEAEGLGFSNPPPSWSCALRVSCSS